MSWFHRLQQPPLAPPADVSQLSGTPLNEELTRASIEKTRVEILDERAWRAKLLLSFLVPLGAALSLGYTWLSDRASERAHRDAQTYTDAAKQLDSPNAAVRLGAIQTLDSFIESPSWFSATWLGRKLNQSAADHCDFDPWRLRQDPAQLRARQSVALIVGRLSQETEAAVLDAISRVAQRNPCTTLAPLLSVDRSATVQFARAAGNFAAFYALHKRKAVSLNQGPDKDKLSQQMVEAVVVVTARTGSPFEARDTGNQVFVSSPILSNTTCPFSELYNKQFELIATALKSPMLSRPPTVKDVAAAMDSMEHSAALLEKVSYVLGHFAQGKQLNGHPNIDVLSQYYKEQDGLYGAAIVVGEIPDDIAARLQKMGAFIQENRLPGPNLCPPRPLTLAPDGYQ